MYKVVLIDDEPWALEINAKIFDWESEGFQVVGKTTDAQEGYEMIQTLSPDVVFTDISMAQMSGLEIIGETNKNHIKKTLFVIISGYADFKYAQEAIAQGVFEYCLKPIKREYAAGLLERLKKRLDEMNHVSGIESSIDLENKSFQKMIKYINTHFDEKLQLEALCEKFYLSTSYCSLLFKRNFHMTFSEYTTDIRMKNAAGLLKKGEDVNTAAQRSGYTDYYYFNRVFKKYYGVTPASYRKSGGLK